MEEFNKKSLVQYPGEIKEVKPDLIMDIKVTPEIMKEFGVEIYKSKLIRLGREGVVEDDIGTIEISDQEIDFSKAKYMFLKYCDSKNIPFEDRSMSFEFGDYLELTVIYPGDKEKVYYISANAEMPILNN